MAKELKVNITGDGRKLDAELTKTASEMARLERQTKQAQKELNNMNKSCTNLKGGLNNLMSGIKGCDFSSISKGITDIGTNASSVLPNLGSMATSLVNPYTLAATAIIGAGKALFDYNKQLEESLQRTAQFTGLSGDELMSLRNGIKSVADTFGKDYNDVLGTVDGLMNQFGISGEEALQIIRDGFVGGADDSGKMFDMISKYSGAFNDAGISASELVAIIGNTRSGIFSEDGMELFSKGATKIREFSDKLKTSLQGVGIDADAMYEKLQSGEMTTVQAIQEISSHIKGLSPQSQEVGEVLKNVFGKKGAEAGYELVTALADVETDLSKVKEQTGEWGDAMEQLQQADREMENALSSLFGIADGGFSTMTTKLKAEVYGAVAKVINGFIDWYNKSLILRGAIANIALTFKNTWEVIKAILKLFINSVKSLSDVIEGVFTLDWDKVKSGWKNGVENILKTVSTGFENIKNNYDNAVEQTLHGEIKKIPVEVDVDYSKNNKPITTTNTNNEEDSKNGKDKGKGNKTTTTTNKVKVEAEEGSIKDLQNRLQKLNDELNNTNVSDERLQEINNEKREIESQIQVLKERNGLADKKVKVNVETVLLSASLKQIEEDIEKTKAELSVEVEGSERYKELQSELNRLTSSKHEVELKLNTSKLTDELKDIDSQLQTKITQIQVEVEGTERFNQLQTEIDNLITRRNEVQLELNPVIKEGTLAYLEQEISKKEAQLKLSVVGSEEYYELAKSIAELTGKKNEIELQVNADTMDDVTKKTKEFEEAQKKAQETMQKNQEFYNSLGSTFSSLGKMIGGAGGKMLEMAGQTMQAVAQIIPQIVSLIGAKQAESLAGATAQVTNSPLPFPANIAAIASVIATITALFASFAGNFASGGIIGGSTTVGDYNIARVNAGEMILNNRQQGRLFNLLDGNGYYNQNPMGGNVEFKIKGDTLYGCLKNYSNLKSKIGKNTGIK